jgi:hypothetical protein
VSKAKDWRDTWYHRLLGRKAAQFAVRVLPLFETDRPGDPRPRNAIKAIEAWARGKRKLGMQEVRKLSLDSHAAARAAGTAAARFAARAAGHAVATWHVPTHALGAPMYAERAMAAVRASSPKPGSTRPSRRRSG